MTERKANGAEGERTAFALLFRQHYAGLVQAVFRVLGCRQEAEEIAAEAFARLFRQGSTIENPAGWLRRCAVRAALDALRASARRRRREEQQEGKNSGPPTPAEVLERKEQQARVRLVLGELPVRDGEILLARFDGASYVEIAAQCGIQTGSVGTLLARAERNFRKRYEERYGRE